MSTSTDFKILEIPVDGVNSYIPPIIINEADNNGRRLKFTPTYEGQPVTGITSARMYYDPRPRDASSIGDYVDGTKDGDGWVFVLPPNTFTANVQGIASVSFTDEDGETYTRSMPIYVESGGTKADSQGTRIDRLIATLERMVNDFTMTAEAETGEAGSQANVTVTKMNGGAYNLKFVIPRGDKGDTGDAATIQLGTVTTGNPGTNAEITNSGTENTAVFNFTIPRGDVGPAGVNENVPIGSTSGVVAQATDAYPALPRKVQVHGRTINNLWGNPVGSTGGFTASQNEDGSLHISGAGESNASIAKTISLSPSTQYTLACDKTALNIRGFMVRENLHDLSNLDHVVAGSDVSGNLTNTFTTSPDLVSVGLYVLFSGGQTVSGDYKLMLVEGNTVPDVFVPSGVNTVKPTKLIISGVNFADLSQAVRYKNRGALISSKTSSKIEYTGANSNTDTIFDLGITLPAGAYYIDYGNNVSNIGANIQDATSKLSFNGYWEVYYGNPDRITFDEPFNLFIGPKAGSGVIDDFQISLTDSEYKEPIVSNINIPSDISLADGDTLAIDRDGTTQIIHTEGEPTVLENVTLPQLPAPTFNAYTTGGYIQPTVDVGYEQDVNLVIANLEAKIAALQVADKTN